MMIGWFYFIRPGAEGVAFCSSSIPRLVSHLLRCRGRCSYDDRLDKGFSFVHVCRRCREIVSGNFIHVCLFARRRRHNIALSTLLGVTVSSTYQCSSKCRRCSVASQAILDQATEELHDLDKRDGNRHGDEKVQ